MQQFYLRNFWLFFICTTSDKVMRTEFAGGITIKTAKPNGIYELTEDIEAPLDLRAHLPFRIAVVSNLLALNRDWAIRNNCELDPREMRVLINIGSYMPIKSADIAYQSKMDSYTVSRAVKKLIAEGLIEAEQDLTKKNVKNLVLTVAGTRLYRQITDRMLSRSDELESCLNPLERELLFNILGKLETKVEGLLANQAQSFIEDGLAAPADQKELIRWYKKSLADKPA